MKKCKKCNPNANCSLARLINALAIELIIPITWILLTLTMIWIISLIFGVGVLQIIGWSLLIIVILGTLMVGAA